MLTPLGTVIDFVVPLCTPLARRKSALKVDVNPDGAEKTTSVFDVVGSTGTTVVTSVAVSSGAIIRRASDAAPAGCVKLAASDTAPRSPLASEIVPSATMPAPLPFGTVITTRP